MFACDDFRCGLAVTSRFLWLAPYTNEILDVDTSKKKDLSIRPRKPHYVQELTRWLGRGRPHEWPARSPGFTPCEFFLWGWAKKSCTGQNLAQWNNWRTGFGTLSPMSHTTSCRRLWIPSLVVWGSWWMPPVLTLNFKLYVHIPI